VSHFFDFFWFVNNGEEEPKNKAPGTETGEKPRSSKWKATQQSAPLASTQEEFFNLPWKDYVSIYVPFTYLFSLTFV